MKINEASFGRIYTKMQGVFAIISAYSYLNEKPEQNIYATKCLRQDIRDLGLGYNEFVVRWAEADKDGNIKTSDEASFLISGIKKSDAIQLGEKYLQSSIIYSDGKTCEEICTHAFTDLENIEWVPYEVVRRFNVSHLDLTTAKEIFAGKVAGPASMLAKGGNKMPFKLPEILEKIEPRASYFQTKPIFEKIISFK